MRLPALLVLVVTIPLRMSAAETVRVEVRTGAGARVVELPLKQYVAAVLAGESSVFHSAEALKAMAVAARTYAVRMKGRHAKDGFDFCDTTHCQRIELENIAPRLQAAAEQTAGELLWYRAKPAFTPYTRDCGGRTEDAASLWPELAQPYLKSHPDPYCSRAGSSAWQWTGDPRRILSALQDAGLRAPAGMDRVAILSRTASGRASLLDLEGSGGSSRISADSFRFAILRALGWNTLRSDLYQAHAANGRIVFDGKGSGHGVGLCQDGAEQMGAEGRSYREILAFYYPGTVVGVTAQGLSWQRLSGDSITLLTTQPGADRTVLADAERIEHKLAERTRWPLPQNVELRVYPDLDTFRNATAEPGWVAASTSGRTIRLQPTAVLRAKGVLESTLTHELAHALIASQKGAAALPVWFEEGLAAYLQAGSGPAPASIPPDGDFKRTADPARTRRAYAEAQAEIGALVRRYGETAVLGWVKLGLPAQVARASASQPPANSR